MSDPALTTSAPAAPDPVASAFATLDQALRQKALDDPERFDGVNAFRKSVKRLGDNWAAGRPANPSTRGKAA